VQLKDGKLLIGAIKRRADCTNEGRSATDDWCN